jgi:protoheme IX farnesyltransferase
VDAAALLGAEPVGARDYEAAGVPMLPVASGARATRLQILLYTAALAPLGLAPGRWASPARPTRRRALLGLVFLWHAWRVWREPQDALGRSLAGDAAAKRTFRYSLLYLAALFAALPLDRLVPA